MPCSQWKIARKSLSKQLPAILADLLSKLDVYGDDPILLANDDIPRTAERLVATLVKQGLFLPRIATHITCIKCEGQARVSPVGGRSKKALYASCGTCGSNFPCSEKDTSEFQIDLNGLSGWLSKLMNFPDTPEAISANVSFLGHYEHGTVRYEIHLMRGCASNTAKQDYQAIVQQKSYPAIILSLAKKPHPPSSGDIKIAPIAECVRYKNGLYCIDFPAWVFADVDPVKQHAGRIKAASTPIQKQKEKLHEFVRKNLNSKFLTMMHHDIAKAIIRDYSQWITYQDNRGNQKLLSADMVRAVVKDVLIEKGLSERISGRKTTDA